MSTLIGTALQRAWARIRGELDDFPQAPRHAMLIAGVGLRADLAGALSHAVVHNYAILSIRVRPYRVGHRKEVRPDIRHAARRGPSPDSGIG